MKKMVRRSAVIAVCAGSLVTAPLVLKPCGPWVDTLLGVTTQQQDSDILAVVIEGNEFGLSLVNQVITSLTQLYTQNPAAFDQFFTACVVATGSPFPADVLALLQQFNLVDSNAQISDMVKLVVSWAVEQNTDGSMLIWPLDTLINEGWVNVALTSNAA